MYISNLFFLFTKRKESITHRWRLGSYTQVFVLLSKRQGIQNKYQVPGMFLYNTRYVSLLSKKIWCHYNIINKTKNVKSRQRNILVSQKLMYVYFKIILKKIWVTKRNNNVRRKTVLDYTFVLQKMSPRQSQLKVMGYIIIL